MGEASIKIYTENQADEAIELENILKEMSQLQVEEFPLPNEVRSLVEASKKINYIRSGLCHCSK